jgi:hypothetical protein
MTLLENLELFFNASIFAIFFAIASTELMAGSMLIFYYKETNEEIKKFIVPIWEITGTFLVFYVVNVEALVPSLIPILAYVYIPYILLFIFVYGARNGFIIFAEFIGKTFAITEEQLYKLYGFVTLILGTLLLIAYGSLISGVGVDLNNYSFDLFQYLSYWPDVGFVLGSALIYFGLAHSFFRVEKNYKLSLSLTVFGVLMNSLSFIYFTNFKFYNYLILPIVFTLIIPVMNQFYYTRKYARNKILYLILMSLTVGITEKAILPYLFGGKINVIDYFPNSAIQVAMFQATIIGGTLVGIFLAYYFYFYFKKIERNV